MVRPAVCLLMLWRCKAVGKVGSGGLSGYWSTYETYGEVIGFGSQVKCKVEATHVEVNG